MNNQHYWTEKEQRAKKAQEHVKNMEFAYQNYIQDSVKTSVIYTDANLPQANRTRKIPIISVSSDDSVTAIMKECNKLPTCRVSVLNFASYTNVGGMFLQGSKAQEECLCHESTLYNVLRNFPNYYTKNNQDKNKALYRNRALYSPKVVFLRNDNEFAQQAVLCDVITCAAPNYTTAKKYCNVSEQENLDALRSRIKFVLNCANVQYVDTLILGAYGAGVFGQNPYEVASIFKEELLSGQYGFANVIFAVLPIPDDKNLNAFKEIFKA